MAEEDPRDSERFLREFNRSNTPIWYRYMKAVAGNPITWWIGIMQVMMVLGTFGHKHQRDAQIRQNVLYQALHKAYEEVGKPQYKGRKLEIILYALEHRLPEVLGRLHGGVFTGYAATGGRIGARSGRSLVLKGSLIGTNYVIASFGALIASVGQTLSADDILLAVLTGETGTVPKQTHHLMSPKHKQDIEQIDQEFDEQKSLLVIQALNNISARPVPLSEFCANPENAKLRGLCR